MEEKIKAIINDVICARVMLEQGGKYNWNIDLQSCDDLLKEVLRRLEGLK